MAHLLSIVEFATILSPIVSAIAIWIALWISHKSSKDMSNLIESNRLESTKQINALRSASFEEIRQIRILTHAILATVIHKLKSENLEISEESDELNNLLNNLMIQYDSIKKWEITDTQHVNMDEINAHFAEIYKLKSSIMLLTERCQKLKKSSAYISNTLENLNKALDAYCEFKS